METKSFVPPLKIESNGEFTEGLGFFNYRGSSLSEEGNLHDSVNWELTSHCKHREILHNYIFVGKNVFY